MLSHIPDHLNFDLQDAVAIETVSRPRVLNALRPQTLDGLRRAMLAFRNHTDVGGAVVVTGAGNRAFVGSTGPQGS